MESFLNRYRNITVLLLVIFAQLVLLAMQVKNDQDVRFIRVWAITTVTPVARIVEWFRGGSIGFVRRYILLHDASQENRQLRDEVGRLRLQNTFLQDELNTADRAKALQVFQAHTPSKMLAANVIGVGAGGGSTAKVVFVNRGSGDGVMRGMAVVTPDGIVGKVISSYPTGASEVLLITDPEFAAGVISQKSQSRGTLKGQGTPLCKVDYVPFEDKVEPGEWFYTSGDDRIFPRGFAVGVAKVVRPGTPYKEILVQPSGMQHGLEDVLIILESTHQAIPDAPAANQPVYIAPPPPQQQAAPAPAATDPANPAAAPATGTQPTGTEADRLRTIYKSVGEAQNHNFGEGAPGSKPPDFTKLPSTPLPPAAASPAPAASAPSKSVTPPKPGGPAQSPTGQPAPASAASKSATSGTAVPKSGGAAQSPTGQPAPASAAPKSATPGTAVPKSGGPAQSPTGQPAPASAASKSATPGTAVPKSGGPAQSPTGQPAPASAAPKSATPGTAVPKSGGAAQSPTGQPAPASAAPKSATPGTAVPKSGGPAQSTTGQPAPASTPPKSATPGTAVPKSGGPAQSPNGQPAQRVPRPEPKSDPPAKGAPGGPLPG